MDLPGWLSLVSDGRVAVGGAKLRHWGISETWRIEWADGSTAIVKRGAGEEALALDVYEQLVIPHRIAAPRLITAYRGDGFAVLVFEDLGPRSLDTNSSTKDWLATARLLARLRHRARDRIDAAQVGAHLGDLYSLVQDAGLTGEPTDRIIAAYADECASLGALAVDLEWQLALGGVVWTLRALRWVLEEGIHVVPEATTWIDELVERAGHAAEDLRASMGAVRG